MCFCILVRLFIAAGERHTFSIRREFFVIFHQSSMLLWIVLLLLLGFSFVSICSFYFKMQEFRVGIMMYLWLGKISCTLRQRLQGNSISTDGYTVLAVANEWISKSAKAEFQNRESILYGHQDIYISFMFQLVPVSQRIRGDKKTNKQKGKRVIDHSQTIVLCLSVSFAHDTHYDQSDVFFLQETFV